MKQRLTLVLICGAAWLTAHPMGNFSISHYARFEERPAGLELTYALDLAEIPTFELLRDWKLERGSARAELEARANQQARAWLAGLKIRVNGTPAAPRLRSAQLVIADGAGNLPVIRITARAEVKAGPGRVEYEDTNYPDRAGWKEIVMPGGKDVSRGLTAYPEDVAVAPPQDLRAAMVLRAPVAPTVMTAAAQEIPKAQPEPAAGGPRETAPGTVQKGDYLSQLLGKQNLSFGMILMGLAAAFGLGAMHALSPGHGKTIVAAYLVGSRGTFGHAMFLGAMVTFTHTVSVFLLGLGTLFLSKYVQPDRIIPVLSVISGLMIVWIGAVMFWKRLKKLAGGGHHHHKHDHDHHHHDHEHEHEHAHAHAHAHAHGHDHHQHHDHGHQHDHHHHDHHHHDHDHDHHHGPGGHSHVPEGEVTMGSLVGLAVSGGMAPCPSALVLLLSAIALGRIAFGLALLTAFSLGLAAVLIAIGCAVLYAKHLLPDTPKVTNSTAVRAMPVVSAGIITVVGMVMTAVAAGWVRLPVN
jgi:ABC-type nickel/cobalt efflux system permease component RcnA